MAQESNQVSSDPAAESEVGATTAPSPSRTTTEIRAQIEQTRAEMTETIDAIQERLSPGRILTEAKESVSDATIGRVKRLATRTNGAVGSYGGYDTLKRVADAVKANPLPFAMATAAAVALSARALARSGDGSHRGSRRRRVHSVAQPRSRWTTFGGNKQRLLLGACAAGFACWNAWRQNSRGAALRSASGSNMRTF